MQISRTLIAAYVLAGSAAFGAEAIFEGRPEVGPGLDAALVEKLFKAKASEFARCYKPDPQRTPRPGKLSGSVVFRLEVEAGAFSSRNIVSPGVDADCLDDVLSRIDFGLASDARPVSIKYPMMLSATSAERAGLGEDRKREFAAFCEAFERGIASGAEGPELVQKALGELEGLSHAGDAWKTKMLALAPAPEWYFAGIQHAASEELGVPLNCPAFETWAIEAAASTSKEDPRSAPARVRALRIELAQDVILQGEDGKPARRWRLAELRKQSWQPLVDEVSKRRPRRDVVYALRGAEKLPLSERTRFRLALHKAGFLEEPLVLADDPTATVKAIEAQLPALGKCISSSTKPEDRAMGAVLSFVLDAEGKLGSASVGAATIGALPDGMVKCVSTAMKQATFPKNTKRDGALGRYPILLD